MKKLFFTALVAAVAIGGASTLHAATFYENGTDNSIECDLLESPSCTTVTGVAIGRQFPASNPSGQGASTNLSDYQYTGL